VGRGIGIIVGARVGRSVSEGRGVGPSVDPGVGTEEEGCNDGMWVGGKLDDGSMEGECDGSADGVTVSYKLPRTLWTQTC
jgi:hypothetical protein